MVCYYGSWAVYRPGDGKFPVEEIDPFLCTHLIYGFAGLGHDNRIRSLDSWNDLKDNYGKGAFLRFTTGLKAKNPKLKTIIAIGGWNEGSMKYSAMAETASSRKYVDVIGASSFHIINVHSMLFFKYCIVRKTNSIYIYGHCS